MIDLTVIIFYMLVVKLELTEIIIKMFSTKGTKI